jgi:hypothetical protein
LAVGEFLPTAEITANVFLHLLYCILHQLS